MTRTFAFLDRNNDPVYAPEPIPPRMPLDELLAKADEQRGMVRWWAAECRARNAACRCRFTRDNVAAATDARRHLRIHAEAWSATRAMIRSIQSAKSAA